MQNIVTIDILKLFIEYDSRFYIYYYTSYPIVKNDKFNNSINIVSKYAFNNNVFCLLILK